MDEIQNYSFDENCMTTNVLGVGIGLFLIISLWLATFVICALSIRTQNNIGSIAVGAATIITLTLILIPRESEVPAKPVFKLYDKLFVWRTLLLAFLGLSTLVGFVIFLLTHLMEPRRAQAIKQWKL